MPQPLDSPAEALATGTAEAFIAETADVADPHLVGPGTRIWHLAQLREGAEIGSECIVGRSAYIGPGVRVGSRCKIQNHALVYEPAELGDGVFIGPAAVLTNDTYPRATTSDGRLKAAADWTAVGVQVDDGASIGARAVCVAPVRIGKWACVGAGAVVVRDVPDYALVAGVPARQIGWVGEAGHRLVEDGERWRCPTTGATYVEEEGVLRRAER